MADAPPGEAGSTTSISDAAPITAKRLAALSSGPIGRAGGIYMPPHRVAAMQAALSNEKSTAEYQRMTWEALRKSINGLINKVNVANMADIVFELLHENLVRGRGLFCRSVLKAQMASPTFTHVYAALVAIINTKLPEVGELLLKRIVLQFRRAFKRNNKVVAVALAKFVAHLVNRQVAHEYLALQLLTLLLERPTDDSVEVAVGFVKECGQILTELSPAGINAIFDRFRAILHEGDVDKRVQYMIEGLFAVRKAKFAEFAVVLPELDLVRQEDQITHEVALDDEDLEADELLDIFRPDPDYAANEEAWMAIRREIIGDEGDEHAEGGEGGEGLDHEDAAHATVVDEPAAVESSSSSAPALPPPAAAGAGMAILDMSETELINLRRTIYLTIMSSIDFEECAHKLMKLNIPRGAESELANMLIECCSQERTYMRYYGLLGQRFCFISSVYQDAFEAAFADQYAHIHRLETNKLRNVAKFFSHLLTTDALPWTVFENIRLTETDTTSASRIFIKYLVQEMSEYLGLVSLRERFNDPVMAGAYAGLFPTDDIRNTRFSINFFTSIGLGALTDTMRVRLAEMAKQARVAAPPVEAPPAPQAAAAAPLTKGGRARSRSASSDSRSSRSSSASSASGAKRSRHSRPKRRGSRRARRSSPSTSGSSSSGSRSDDGRRSRSRSPKKRRASRSPSRTKGRASEHGPAQAARSRPPVPEAEPRKSTGSDAAGGATRRSPSPQPRGRAGTGADAGRGGTRVPAAAPLRSGAHLGDDLMADERVPRKSGEDTGARHPAPAVRHGAAAAMPPPAAMQGRRTVLPHWATAQQAVLPAPAPAPVREGRGGRSPPGGGGGGRRGRRSRTRSPPPPPAAAREAYGDRRPDGRSRPEGDAWERRRGPDQVPDRDRRRSSRSPSRSRSRSRRRSPARR